MAQAKINLAALRHNLGVARSLGGNSKVMAVIKANAYGHGMLEVARALYQADGFAVARLEEAVALRSAGIRHPVLVLSCHPSQADLELVSQQQLWLVIHELGTIAKLAATKLPQAIHAWLKIDTGMHRLGINPVDAPKACQQLRSLENIASLSFMTHFASAEEHDSCVTRQQIAVFKQLALDGPTSLANSAGLIYHNAHRGDWTRPGIMLYGSDPTAGACPALQQVMSLQSRLIAIREVAAGAGVGYNHQWKAERSSRIGTVDIGYGDGYPRCARNGTPTLVGGVRAPLVGRVSMDMLSIDLSDIPAAKVGDEVTLWGPDLPIEEIASCADTISYELITRVSSRVARIYTD